MKGATTTDIEGLLGDEAKDLLTCAAVGIAKAVELLEGAAVGWSAPLLPLVAVECAC